MNRTEFKLQHIHMIAIGGTGMSALAGLLKAAGYYVAGSDGDLYPPVSSLLARLGITRSTGYRPENIAPGTDLVVVGNAVSKSNPEVLAAQERGLRMLSFPQTLSEFFLKDKQPIVVAGTHGKTTTTSLMAWVLESAGLQPGTMIGGWAKSFNGNYQLGKGRYFVVEGDEYDTAFFDKGPKFLHYRPAMAILTSIEFDHGDIYLNLDAIKQAFSAFVRLLPKDGRLIKVYDDARIQEVTAGLDCPQETYGLDPAADWWADHLVPQPESLTFVVHHQRKVIGQVNSPLLGKHNILNTLAVIAMATHLGLSWDRIKSGIESFQGIKRRQEIIGEAHDILVMDDFAHHPTAIHETLSAVRLHYPGRRIWAIFEPRSATSRQKVFQAEFAQSFGPADWIVIADIFAKEKIPVENRLDLAKLVRDLKLKGQAAEFIPTADEIVERVGPQLQSGDLVCILSSGGFGGLHQKLLKFLEEHA
ncbi:MAG TPA: UDP-N-acetylmuramate:L-alanyl-gamma-D-glutamyl-meso-diaminopimelate ligase [Nitrospiria bacterium]|jgi:UDP-N-acetylmuramate: L-alanyl-gamma-D-glutamyl-meso-diaminopimelate ligase|nr:UDP-N-acetylmuramate:L-alanyl-gamma-D-glutamyl-meso-diaminopimelate ligase [Nitrospiria bacterium]